MKTIEIKLPPDFSDAAALKDYFRLGDEVIATILAHRGWLSIDEPRGMRMMLDPRFNGTAMRASSEVLSIGWFLPGPAIEGGPPATRADLMQRPAWADMETDTSGNPLVWRNSYACDDGHHMEEWHMDWSCQCDDDCGVCGASIAPTYAGEATSRWIGPEDHAEIALWESLPDAA